MHFWQKKDKINMHNNFVILQIYNQICLHIVLNIFFSVESIKIWQFKYARCFLFCLRRRLRYLVVANVLSMVYPFSSLVLIFNLHLRICGITEETLHKYSRIISFRTCTIKFQMVYMLISVRYIQHQNISPCVRVSAIHILFFNRFQIFMNYVF